MDSEQIANSFCSEAEALFPFPTRGTTVATFLGRTRVLCMGPETAPPLVIWHAWNTPASLDFQMWGEWSTSFRIYCPAMPGQPGGVVLLPGVNFSEVCGKWAVEVLDGLGIEQCAMFGVSVGCSVLLSVAQIAAPRVSHIALVNPINVMPPTWAMSMRIFWKLRLPLWFLRNVPGLCSEASVLAAVAQTPPDTASSRHLHFLGLMLRTLRHPLPPRGPPCSLARPDLAGCHGPVLAMVSRHDIFSPGDRAAAALRHLLPGGLRAVEVLRDHHVLAEHNRSYVQQRVLRFFRDDR